MQKIKNLFKKIGHLPAKTKIRVVIAFMAAVGLMVTAGVYAWFNEQKKAAEMFKVEYPNSLYINAAHREDRVFFDLGGIDVNAYEKDEYNNTIYYVTGTNTINYALDENDQPVIDEYGHPVYDKTGEAHKIADKKYVFSVSGAGTDEFILQLAHTNNNKFTYTVYPATQYVTAAPSGTSKNDIVKYTTSKDSHTENTLQVIYDKYDDEAEPMDLYYVKGATAINLLPKNNDENNLGIRDDSDTYYKETYGTYSTAKVHEDAMPSYWQADITLADNEIDENKGFCKYYILVVTWNSAQQARQEKKETDMVYLSAKRKK